MPEEDRSPKRNILKAPDSDRYSAFLQVADTIRKSGRPAVVIKHESHTSQAVVYEIKVGEEGACQGRILYEFMVAEEKGKDVPYEVLVAVGPAETEDALALITRKFPDTQSSFSRYAGENPTDAGFRLYTSAILKMYENAGGSLLPQSSRKAAYTAGKETPVFGVGRPRESRIEMLFADETPQQRSSGATPPRGIEVAVEEVADQVPDITGELVGDDEVEGWPDLDEPAKAVPSAPKPEPEPEPEPEEHEPEIEQTQEMVVLEKRLSDILGKDETINEGLVRYLELKKELAGVMAACGEDLARIEYDKLIVLERSKVFNAGSRAMFAPYEAYFNPAEKVTMDEKTATMNEFCETNIDNISLYDVQNPDAHSMAKLVIDFLIPEEGQIALYLTDEELTNSLFTHAGARGNQRSFSEIVNIKTFTLRMGDAFLHFVGEEARGLFKKCYDHVLEECSDLFRELKEPKKKGTGPKKVLFGC